jgi:glycine cleavage system transcriptional repressor
VRETQPRPAETAAPYSIDVVTLDHEGIVFGLSNFFATRNLEISEVNTRRYNAPHTGALMFSVQMTVNLPRTVHVATLREEFLEYCDEQNLDAVMEPAHR